MITRRLFNAAGASALATALAARSAAAQEPAPAAAPAAPAASPPPATAPAPTPPEPPKAAEPAPAPAAAKVTEAPAALPVLDPAGLAASQQALAAKLIVRLSEGVRPGGPRGRAVPAKPAGDTVSVSPMSVAAALAIVAMGCDRATQELIAKALQLPAKLGEPTKTFGAILEAVRQLGSGGGPALATANRLVLDSRMEPFAPVMAGMSSYGVEVSEENLSDPKVIDALNGWVKEKTHDLIRSIIDKPPGSGGLVALNALYFKDKWERPFDPALTKPGDFHGLDGTVTPTQLMHQEGKFLFRQAQKDPIVAVDLPFADGRFALVLVTRTDKPATAGELAAAAQGWLGGDDFSEAPGELAVPRLELSKSHDLLAVLDSAGVRPQAACEARLLRSREAGDRRHRPAHRPQAERGGSGGRRRHCGDRQPEPQRSFCEDDGRQAVPLRAAGQRDQVPPARRLCGETGTGKSLTAQVDRAADQRNRDQADG